MHINETLYSSMFHRIKKIIQHFICTYFCFKFCFFEGAKNSWIHIWN